MPSPSKRELTVSRRSLLQCGGILAIGAVLPRRPVFGHSTEATKAAPDNTGLESVVEFLESEREAGSFPGAAVLVSQRGETILKHFTGTYHNLLGEDKPYQSDVRSLLYSFSKGISATVVMTAHQEKLIDIDATVASYLPDFAANGKDRLTLRQILTHSAGIPGAPTPVKPLRNDAQGPIRSRDPGGPRTRRATQTRELGSGLVAAWRRTGRRQRLVRIPRSKQPGDLRSRWHRHRDWRGRPFHWRGVHVQHHAVAEVGRRNGATSQRGDEPGLRRISWLDQRQQVGNGLSTATSISAKITLRTSTGIRLAACGAFPGRHQQRGRKGRL